MGVKLEGKRRLKQMCHFFSSHKNACVARVSLPSFSFSFFN